MNANVEMALARLSINRSTRAADYLCIKRALRDQSALLWELSECVRTAIMSGDWKVDGACDPEATLARIASLLGDSA